MLDLTLPRNAPGGTAAPTDPRPLVIASGVVLAHVAVLWALHTGLAARVVELIVPAALLQVGTPTTPHAPTQPPSATPPRPAPAQARRPTPTPPMPAAAAPAPAPVLTPPSDNAPTVAPRTDSGAGSPLATATVLPSRAAPGAGIPAPATPALPQPPVFEPPSSDADYLNNPKPIYPRLSKQLREEGRVLVRVHISAEGLPEKIELAQTSGHFRLDQAALDAVAQWRFVPGKRQGVPQAMWYQVPIPFVLR
ncbi:MAG: TonB family protein [Rhodoferax sp.]